MARRPRVPGHPDIEPNSPSRSPATRGSLSSTLAHFRSPISQKSRENQANSTFATPPESLGFAKTRATIAETLENRAILGPENGPKSNSGVGPRSTDRALALDIEGESRQGPDQGGSRQDDSPAHGGAHDQAPLLQLGRHEPSPDQVDQVHHRLDLRVAGD